MPWHMPADSVGSAASPNTPLPGEMPFAGAGEEEFELVDIGSLPGAMRPREGL